MQTLRRLSNQSLSSPQDSAVGVLAGSRNCFGGPVEGRVPTAAVVHGHHDRGPSHHVYGAELNRGDMTVVHTDEDATLGAGFVDVSRLEAAREDHPGLRVEDSVLVDVAESPVVVLVCDQTIDAAGGIGPVCGVPLGARMQEPYVDPSWHSGRVGGAEVGLLPALGIPVPVDSQAQLV